MPLPESGDRPLLLHNPRCSKSRAARALLEERQVDFDERLYLDDPLSREELEELGRRLGKPPLEWARGGEAAWKEAGLPPEPDTDSLLKAMVDHPILVERPILIVGPEAVVGRPPERVLGLF